MKFPHLPLGQRFVYQDERYTKTGPMTASRERFSLPSSGEFRSAWLPCSGVAQG